MQITGLKFTPDGESLLLVSEQNLYKYNLKEKTCHFLFHNIGLISPDLLIPSPDGVYLINGKDLITYKYGTSSISESIFPDEIKYCCFDPKEELLFFVYAGSPSCLYLYNLKSKNIVYLAKSTKPITGMTMHPDLPIIGMNYDLKRSSSGIFSFHYMELINPIKTAA
jgi:WD40 repeat protein